MSLPNIKIIELYGLPGCGKSTLTKYLLELIQKRCPNNIIIRRTDISMAINKYWNNTIFLFFILIFQLLRPINYKTKISLLRYTISFPFNRYSIIYLLYTIITIDLYKENKTKIIVLDEGIIQFLSSIPHDISLNKTKLLNRIARKVNKMPFDVLYVKCDLDLSINLQRIKQRNRNDRFAYRDGLDSLLSIKKNNLTLIADTIAINKLTIDMQKPYDLNAVEIMNHLLK